MAHSLEFILTLLECFTQPFKFLIMVDIRQGRCATEVFVLISLLLFLEMLNFFFQLDR